MIENSTPQASTLGKFERFTVFDWIVLIVSILFVGSGISDLTYNVVLLFVRAKFDVAVLLTSLIWLAVAGAVLKSKSEKFEKLKSKKSHQSLVRIVILFSVVMLLLPLLSAYLAFSSGRNVSGTPEQQKFADNFPIKGAEISASTQLIKADTLAFLSALETGDNSLLNEKSKILLSDAIALRANILGIQAYLLENKDIFPGEAQKKGMASLGEVFAFRAEHNEKLIQLSELGSKITLGDQDQAEKFIKIAGELAAIEARLPEVQRKYLAAVAEFDPVLKAQMETELDRRNKENAALLEGIKGNRE